MSGLKVTNNIFWVLLDEEMTLFTDRDEAISKLTGLENPSEAKLMTLTCENQESWHIEQVSWKEIASDLMKAMKSGV